MRKLLLLFVLSSQITRAEKLPLLDQLISLNKNWQGKSLPAALKDSVSEQLDDVTLIRLHLKLVEEALQKGTAVGLSKQQIEKRMSSISALRAYRERGVFPKNYHFNHRQPVFIDEHGTYCAVGEMIKESGHAALAQVVHQENNYGYVEELNKLYPALGGWAAEFGFTIAELAWIQPCYGNTCADTIGLVHPTCYKAYNGYFRPDYVTFKTIKSRKLYKLIGTNWTHWYNALCGYSEPCNLIAGQYKWEITDSVDVVHTFSATLVAPDSAVVSILQLGDFSTCNGTIVVTPIGGAPPFRYKWQNETSFTKDSIRTGFCEQLVKVTVVEALFVYCDQRFEFNTGPVAINEFKPIMISLIPNPCNDFLQLKGLSPTAELKIYNSATQLLLQTVASGDIELNLSEFASGIYFIEIIDKVGSGHYKFIKQ